MVTHVIAKSTICFETAKQTFTGEADLLAILFCAVSWESRSSLKGSLADQITRASIAKLRTSSKPQFWYCSACRRGLSQPVCPCKVYSGSANDLRRSEERYLRCWLVLFVHLRKYHKRVEIVFPDTETALLALLFVYLHPGSLLNWRPIEDTASITTHRRFSRCCTPHSTLFKQVFPPCRHDFHMIILVSY